MGQTAEDRRASRCLPAGVGAAIGSPSILRAPDAAPKELTVKFEDSKPLDVHRVLEQLHAGNTDPYDELCRELAKGLMSSSLLGETLDELHRCAGDLCGERHLSLIRASLACSWHHLSQHYTQRYFALVVLLATTQPSCASDAVKVLVHTLQYNEEFDQLDGSADPPFAGDLTEKELRVHGLALDALVSILRIIPMALDLVMSTVIGRMPYHKRPARQQAAYISSMLRLSSLLPNCRPRLLRAVYQRLIQLDLLCPRSDLTASSSEDSLDDLHQQLPQNNNPLEAAAADGELVAALDTLMSVTLQHFVRICYGPSASFKSSTGDLVTSLKSSTGDLVTSLKSSTGDLVTSLRSSTGDLVTVDDQRLDWAATKKLYSHLLTVVDELGLPTPSTAHTQFLAFWLACRRAALAEHWTDWLWRRVAECPSAPALHRQTAAVYLGSFMARATLANIGLVRATLEVMCGWVHRYLDRQEGVCGRGLADFIVHRPFYAVCQTIFYVIAFRHTEMPPTNAHLPFLRSLKLDRLVTSRLNPLQFCLPVVVRNFASVARHYQLAYCYTVIERNSRARIPVVFETSFGLKRPLTEGCQLTYFPFDPYLLKHSRRFITGIYREYAGQVVMSDSESSDSNDDGDDDDDLMEQDSVHQFSCPLSIGLKTDLGVTGSGDSVLTRSSNLLLGSSDMI